ncbi:MAG: hypothetical protein LWW94_08020 [Candidatus Desulfofervidaceae bacterium]|nr:hypothetical protein [Candidatus Desulfofervidaceae bacterium]
MDKRYELIELGHKLFQIIEDRDFSYQLAFNAIHLGKVPSSDDILQLKNSVDEWIDYDDVKKCVIKKFIDSLSDGRCIKGKLLLLYLLSWNMNRFSDCSNFQIEHLLNF